MFVFKFLRPASPPARSPLALPGFASFLPLLVQAGLCWGAEPSLSLLRPTRQDPSLGARSPETGVEGREVGSAPSSSAERVEGKPLCSSGDHRLEARTSCRRGWGSQAGQAWSWPGRPAQVRPNSNSPQLGLFLKIIIIIIPWLHGVSTAAQPAALGLSCPMTRGVSVPQSEVEPPSLELQGRLLTTGPPGKFRHLRVFFLIYLFLIEG